MRKDTGKGHIVIARVEAKVITIFSMAAPSSIWVVNAKARNGEIQLIRARIHSSEAPAGQEDGLALQGQRRDTSSSCSKRPQEKKTKNKGPTTVSNKQADSLVKQAAFATCSAGTSASASS